MEIDASELFRIFVVQVLYALLCGGLIGLERQLRGKAIGLRVCMLVVLTTAFFVTIATEIAVQSGDALRVVSSVITGVGFLGGGVIFSQGGRVQGITTATLIWALAAIGCVIGFGYPSIALLTTFTIVATIGFVDWLEWQFPKLNKEFESNEEDTK